MTFLFAYLGTLSDRPGWPIHLMYSTEAVFVIVAFACAIVLKRIATQWVRDALAVVGGVSAGFGLIMPFELAPFFFRAPGEIMLVSIFLNLTYPVAAVLFILLYRNFMLAPQNDGAEDDLSAASNTAVEVANAAKLDETERAARDLLSVIRAHPGQSDANLDAAFQQLVDRVDPPPSGA
jgi:thiosulfate dehydrogenase (quinone) large subunit